MSTLYSPGYFTCWLLLLVLAFLVCWFLAFSAYSFQLFLKFINQLSIQFSPFPAVCK